MEKLEDLIKGLHGTDCSGRDCSKCKGHSSEPKLCSEIMCIATPGEIAGLINAGFAHLLRIIPATKVSVDMKTRSVERSRVWMVQIAADGNGCAMHRNGTCLLSGAGLTPKTGSFHLQGDGVAVKKRYPEVIEAWEDTDNIPAIGFALLTIMNQDNAEGKHTN